MEIEQQNRTGGASVHQTVDSLFRSDDKLLSSLQKLGWELDTEDPEEQDNVVMLRETCARSASFFPFAARQVKLTPQKTHKVHRGGHSNKTRSHLSRVTRVINAIGHQQASSRWRDFCAPRRARVVIRRDFTRRTNVNRTAISGAGPEGSCGEEWAGARQVRASRRLRMLLHKINALFILKLTNDGVQIHDCLEYLLDHVHELSSRIETFQAYQVAASSVGSLVRSELATSVELSAKKERRPTVGASPTRRRSLNQGSTSSPARTQPRPRHTRRSSGVGTGIPDDPPVDEILRNLAISLPVDDASSANVKSQAQALAAILVERRAKVHDVAHNVQEAFEASANKQLADAKVAIQMARDSLLAESPFGRVQLVDPEIDGSIAVLGQELEEVQARLEVVDAGLVKARGRNAKKEELIRRWGS